MIRTRDDLNKYLRADAASNGRNRIRPSIFGDEIWKFIISLRKLEYYENQIGWRRWLTLLPRLIWKFRYHKLSVVLNYTIPVNVADKGFSIAHYGTIVIAKTARIGKNCRIHEGVTIGSTNGSRESASIGDNVFIASGAKIIGDVTIADDVAIGANAVVTKSILERGTTWGGVPAQKISNNDSRGNLCVTILPE